MFLKNKRKCFDNCKTNSLSTVDFGQVYERFLRKQTM